MGDHRGARNASRTTPHRTRGGARRASRSRKSSRLPSASMLGGAAALTVAVVGTMGAASPVTSLSAHSTHTFAQPNAMSGVAEGAKFSRGQERQAAVSRDSRRDALEDTAKSDLTDSVESQATERNAAYKQLSAQAEKVAKEYAQNKWVKPLDSYRLTARFGQSSSLWSRNHTGLDFAAPSGTPIRAIANGTVTSTGYEGSYGNQTVITLEDGTELWFCHQTSFAVEPGDTVRAGEIIGYVGSTGNSTGPHMHLEVRPGGGDPVDPYQAALINGLQF